MHLSPTSKLGYLSLKVKDFMRLWPYLMMDLK